MIKTIEVNKRKIKAFIIDESESRILYINLKSLHFKDYQRLKEVSDRAPNDMLAELKRSKHPGNNRNMLVMYDGLINVLSKKAGNRSLMKANTEKAMEQNELIRKLEQGELELDAYGNPVEKTEEQPQVIQEQEEQPKPKRRGRPPKSEQSDQS
jgi:hypothetical protein